jgi:membrane protease YdiL (CAAX protease family)
MNELNNSKISTGKTLVGIVLAIVIMVAAQTLANIIATLPILIGVPIAVGNVLVGILYAVFTVIGVKWLCTKRLGFSLEECKVPKFSLKPIWCIAAVVMPCMVTVILLLTNGHWENSSVDTLFAWELITGAVFFYGIGTGIVEEIIFRGVIMRTLEERWNKKVAIIVPSVLFGLIHVITRELDFLSIIQLLIAGSIVGILFSLVTYESGSIWNAALIHAVWNMIIVGGILNIGATPSEYAIYNYVLDSDSFLITGGDFGIEASVVAILAYAIFIGVAVLLMKKKK